MHDAQITLTKTLVALGFGPAAVFGIWVCSAPDGDNFVGALRDDIRVSMVAEQVVTLTNAIRHMIGSVSARGSAKSSLTAALIESGGVPIRMIDGTVVPPVIRSPWGTEIALSSEGHSFSISVPVSSYACAELLLKLGRGFVANAYANGVRQQLPLASKSDVQGCTANAINVVKFSFI